ncbi:cysteine hydrolase [Caballeronia sp. LZ065]|uniref:cysteine hydrolase family protein n=1 Tax=Caballeronia sp. LZ065 TaxID=3038571 RepID=UPI002856CC3F|nr:cysteine hydrolase [Caballeronia sp. LZ065]MDR5781101.1 cysteine hydrolase [Caballeronia sp. LZ065]
MTDTIFLVLDMENDLIHADGPNGKGGYGEQVSSRGIIEHTRTAIDKARAAGVPVGFVRVGFSPDYRECPADSPIFSGARKNGLLKLGAWGTEIHPDLGKRDTDFDIVKHRVSPFYATDLEVVLRTLGARHIVCCGVSTNAVVQAMVREGHDRDYRITVLEDCCCALTAEEHASAVQNLKRFCAWSNSVEYAFE